MNGDVRVRESVFSQPAAFGNLHIHPHPHPIPGAALGSSFELDRGRGGWVGCANRGSSGRTTGRGPNMWRPLDGVCCGSHRGDTQDDTTIDQNKCLFSPSLHDVGKLGERGWRWRVQQQHVCDGHVHAGIASACASAVSEQVVLGGCRKRSKGGWLSPSAACVADKILILTGERASALAKKVYFETGSDIRCAITLAPCCFRGGLFTSDVLGMVCTESSVLGPAPANLLQTNFTWPS